MKIARIETLHAAMADTYEVNVAPHNFYGHLATMQSAHYLHLPTGPGWGTEVNEAAVHAHPSKSK